MVVVVAGMGGNGTGGRRIRNGAALYGGAGGEGAGRMGAKNLQALIETKLIDGHPGPPGILATHFW